MKLVNKGSKMSLAIGLVVGALVGWTLPEPEWSKKIKAKVMSWFA